jgi:hypothetical protein
MARTRREEQVHAGMVPEGATRSENRSPVDGPLRCAQASPGWPAPPLPGTAETRRDRPCLLVRPASINARANLWRLRSSEECVTGAARQASYPTRSGSVSLPPRYNVCIAPWRVLIFIFPPSQVGLRRDEEAEETGARPAMNVRKAVCPVAWLGTRFRPATIATASRSGEMNETEWRAPESTGTLTARPQRERYLGASQNTLRSTWR